MRPYNHSQTLFMLYQVAALCYKMLHLLSRNEHVATRMGKDPSFQATIVTDLGRQLIRRKAAHAKHLADIRQQSDWNAAPARTGAAETEGDAFIEPVADVDRKGADDLSSVLRMLGRVLRATRRASAGISFMGEQQESALRLPQPLHFLYGESHYGVAAEGDEGGKEVPPWPLNCDLIHDIAEHLVGNPNTPATETVSARRRHSAVP